MGNKQSAASRAAERAVAAEAFDPAREAKSTKKLEAMKDDAKVLDARVAYWEDGAELARALRTAAN